MIQPDECAETGFERHAMFAGLVLDNAYEHERQPAKQDMRADAFFFPVVHWAQLQRLLERTECGFNLEELFVSSVTSSAESVSSDV
jgi:hypothetical protein